MTYWHMQIKYYDILEEDTKLFLNLNDTKDNKPLFEIMNNEVKDNDLILIKDRNRPQYLVQIIGKIKNNIVEITRFDLNTKILDDYPLGTVDTKIQKIDNPTMPAYKYIKKLYDGNVKELITDIKLKELSIKEFKMFKNLIINFTDKENNPLPIVIIAGANGIGKTSLLELIFSFKNYYRNFLGDGSYFKAQYKDIEIKIDKNHIKNYELIEKENKRKTEVQFSQGDEIAISFIPDEFHGLIFLEKNITYIKALDDNMDNVKKNILSYYRRESRKLDSYNKALEKIRGYIKKIFTSIDLTFELLDVNDTDRDNEKVTFKNKNGKEFDINQLSSGEKTLLSKVLYLYFGDLKNQIILIDEPELSLHPAWQNRVLKLYETFAKENNCQIIIATHSPHILGSAKNEWIRILRMNENDNVEVINDVLAYGRDIEWVLEEVMGAKSTREESISQKIKECQELLNEDRYDEAEICIDNLEKVIGENDSEVLAMRNSLEFWRE